MPRISRIRVEILRAVAGASGSQTLEQIVALLDGAYTRDQVSDALKWLVPDGALLSEKQKRSHNNCYFMPTRLQPSPGIEFNHQTRTLSSKLDLDLSGPMGWQFQVHDVIRGWRSNASMGGMPFASVSP